MQYTKLSERICNLRGEQSFACVQVSLSKPVYSVPSAKCSSMNKVLGCQWCVTATACDSLWQEWASDSCSKAWSGEQLDSLTRHGLQIQHVTAWPVSSPAVSCSWQLYLQTLTTADSCGSCFQWAGMVCACSRCWEDSCEQTEERSQSPVSLSPAATRTQNMELQCHTRDWIELLMLGRLDSGFYGKI